MIDQMNSKVKQVPVSLQQRAATAIITGVLGVFLIYGVGFAQPSQLHNAAHDGRHSHTFPCH
jgi:cobalt transporter subunit CbtB